MCGSRPSERKSERYRLCVFVGHVKGKIEGDSVSRLCEILRE